MWDKKHPKLNKFNTRDDSHVKKALQNDDKFEDGIFSYDGKNNLVTTPTKQPPPFNIYGLVITAVCAVLTTVLVFLIIYLITKKCRKRNGFEEQSEDCETSSNANNALHLQTYCNPNSANDQNRLYSVYNVCCDRSLQYRQRQIRQGSGCPSSGHTPRHLSVSHNETSANRLSVQDLPSSNDDKNTLNPLYNEDSASEQGSDIEERPSIRDLYILTERSITQQICGKLVVSVTHVVGHKGDVLYLDNMGISLKIPMGAISRGRKEIIFLVLNWDLSDNPEMKCDESLVSPVVYVGPHGLKLNKPCTLTFRHCSYNPCQVRVMRSETELYVRKDWDVMIDQNDVTRQCYFTPDECQIKIYSFTLYTCVQAPFEDAVGKKWLQIAVFACPLRKENKHHQIRVYFLNKTPCALQWAIQNEAKFGGKMVCPEKVFLFDGNSQDMFAKTRYISEQWELVEPGCVDKISFIKIWHGQCPHISICYRRLATTDDHLSNRRVVIEMNLHLFTYQHKHEEDGEKVIIQICEDNITPKIIEESVCQRNHLDKIIIDVNSDLYRYSIEQNQDQSNPSKKVSVTQASDGCKSNLNSTDTTTSEKITDDRFDLDTESPVRRIPYALRKRLKLLLDAKHIFSSDWRDLANELDLSPCIPILSNLESPTEKILDHAENRGVTLEKLRQIFTDIEREDCLEEVDKFITNSVGARIPIENSDSSILCRKNDSTVCQRVLLETSNDMSQFTQGKSEEWYTSREDLGPNIFSTQSSGECVCRSGEQLSFDHFNCETSKNTLNSNRNWILYPRKK